MKDTEYATAVARVRMNENYLLTVEDTERLLTAKSKSEAVAIIVESGLCARTQDGDADFSGALRDMWDLVLGIVPDGEEFAFLLIENDFHNLKTALKATIADVDAKSLMLTPSVIDVDLIIESVRSRKFEQLPDYMSTAAKEAYDLLVSTSDGQLSDAVLDRAYADSVVKLTEKSSPFLQGLAKLISADCAMRIAVRCAKTLKDEQFVELSMPKCYDMDRKELIEAVLKGESRVAEFLSHTKFDKVASQLENGISEFEKASENMLIDYCDSAKFTSLGAAPIAAYIIRKKAQIKTARIVVCCKSAGLDESLIRQRIRKTN